MSESGRALASDRLRHMLEAADAIAHPEIDWSPVARMRDRVTHHYWSTDRNVVWATACDAVPVLRRAVATALEHP